MGAHVVSEGEEVRKATGEVTLWGVSCTFELKKVWRNFMKEFYEG